jgi:hypothetical protein
MSLDQLNPLKVSADGVRQSESLGLDFVHRPEFKILEIRTFRNLGLFPTSREWKETNILLGPLEGANLNRWPTIPDDLQSINLVILS